MVLRPLLVAALLALTPALRACPLPHDDLERQIAALTEELRRSPGDDSLRIRRGDLYRRHRQFDEAFADFAAVRSQRNSETFVLARGRLFRDLGSLRAARAVASVHLETHPEHARVRLLRAEVHQRSGAGLLALADLDQALEELEDAQPDHYLARARIAAACERLGEGALPRALAGLDQGIARLGPIPSLQLAAIDLELGRGGHGAALARLETLRAASPRQERWLAQRGDILGAAGRTEEAREAYRESLVAIRSLKPKQRSTSSVQELERHVLARLRESPQQEEEHARRVQDPSR